MNIVDTVQCGDVLRGGEKTQVSDDDLLLIDRIQASDSSAFDTLVKKYRERVFSVVYNMISNREDAFDLTQDVFIKAFRGIKNFNRKSAFFTWLYRIAVNTTITHIKKNRLRQFFSLEGLSDEQAEGFRLDEFIGTKGADKSLFLKELQEKLNVALQKLSYKHRTAVVLCEVEGLSSAEAASIMECSEGTVRSRLHYAKEQLRVCLQEYLK